MSDSRAARRARWYLLVDALVGLVRLPVELGLWFLKGLYLAVCAVSWALILWVLGERHVGILKALILLASVSVWILLLTSLCSVWF